MIMLQIALFLLADSGLFLNTFLEGYSIDGHLMSIYTESLNDFQNEENKVDSDANKELSDSQHSNLKFFMNLLNLIMTNNSYAVLHWRNYNEKTNHDYKQKVKPVIDKAFSTILTYKLISVLDKNNGQSIDSLKSNMDDQLKNSSDFLSVLHKHSTYSITSEGSQIFTLKPRYLSHKNVFR